MTDFLEYQVYLSYRVPLNADGSPAGAPQLTARNFVRPIKGTEKAKTKKTVMPVMASQSEDVEL